jgi:hypothetical protein
VGLSIHEEDKENKHVSGEKKKNQKRMRENKKKKCRKKQTNSILNKKGDRGYMQDIIRYETLYVGK